MKTFILTITAILLLAGIPNAIPEALVLTLLWLFVCLIALYKPRGKPLRPKHKRLYTGRALS